MTTAVRAVGAKRPRGYVTSANDISLPWAGRAKPAMKADSFVDYGSGFLRKSCDSCVSSKRRCDGQDPCSRCLRRKKPCHYTERKKCGPRSGQKTANGTRRQLASSSAPDSAGSAGADARKQRRQFMEYQQRAIRIHQQQQRQGAGGDESPSSAGDSRGLGTAAVRLPPPSAAPMLSPGELSGETTCVDNTDYSDNGLPLHRVLVRDESGSSWWSLDDQGGSGRTVSTRVTAGSTSPSGSSWPQQEHRFHQQRVGYNEHPTDGVGIVGVSQYERRAQGTGEWSGLSSSSAGGTGSGSGGSTGESWEDDESEESQGQAEEEVAALLLFLGKANEDFEGFSDDEEEAIPERAVRAGGVGIFPKPPARQLPVSNASQEWSI